MGLQPTLAKMIFRADGLLPIRVELEEGKKA